MNPHAYAQRYTQVQVSSFDPKHLLLLVFDGGLRFLRQARTALAADDLPAFGTALHRGQAIVSELQATLDMERGGAIAVDLNRLYDFILLRLTEANAARSVRHMDDVLRVFEPVAAGYREIISGPSAAVA